MVDGGAATSDVWHGLDPNPKLYLIHSRVRRSFSTEGKSSRLLPTGPSRKSLSYSKDGSDQCGKSKAIGAACTRLWWTTVIVSWEANLTDGAVSIITSLLSTVKGKRGVICDLERDWSVSNIPLYIQNNIPFFYLWNFDARVDGCFSRLNPALNLTY